MKEDVEYSIFDDPAENLEEEAYSIFDEPGEFDMDKLLAQEFTSAPVEDDGLRSFEADNSGLADLEDLFGSTSVEEAVIEDVSTDIFGLPEEAVEDFGLPEAALEDFGLPEEAAPDDFSIPEASEDDFIMPMEETEISELDDLLGNLDETSENVSNREPSEVDDLIDDELAELLAVAEVSEAAAKEKRIAKNQKKQAEAQEKRTLWQFLFGNVPVDPSKIKAEPTPEEIAEKKKKAQEDKAKTAEEKKAAREEKKAAAKQLKAEKDRQKAVAKEEKKQKKLEAAKQVLEDMQDTRVNRLGATIVFALFALVAAGVFFGGQSFGYAAGVKNAEKSFNLGLYNDVKHYTDAYEQIYGIKVKPEDQELYDKIMTVMFVNKELSSYHNLMGLADYDAALHALVKGTARYEKYYEAASALGVVRDLDYVRSQILETLYNTYGISEDEAAVLRAEMTAAKVDKSAQDEYNLKLYKIVQESGLLEE